MKNNVRKKQSKDLTHDQLTKDRLHLGRRQRKPAGKPRGNFDIFIHYNIRWLWQRERDRERKEGGGLCESMIDRYKDRVRGREKEVERERDRRKKEI